MFNAKHSGEIKKDQDKETKFMYTKFSPIADCIKQDRKVSLRDMLSLVQTNLLKVYIEMKDKDKIYQFFQTYQKQIYLDSKELEEYLTRTKDDPINNITMALVNESIDNYYEALRIWSQLRASEINQTEGCERTVAILKKKKDIDLTKKYGRWVIEANPKIGLTLFKVDQKTGEQPIDMKPDEVLEYLENIEKESPQKDQTFPYVEDYLEYIIKNNDVPDRFFTLLGSLYIDKLFRLQPPKY